MPNRDYYAINLSSDKFKTNNATTSSLVTNDFKVMHEDKVIFSVDKDGTSMNTINSTTSFDDLSDTPNKKVENGILGVFKNKLSFLRNIVVDSLNSRVIETESLTSNEINTQTLELKKLNTNTINASNIIGEIIEAKSFNGADLFSVFINADNMNAKEIKTDNIHVNKKVDVENIKSSSISSNNLATTNLICENQETQCSVITSLKSESILTKSLQSPLISSSEILSEHIKTDELETLQLSADVIIAKSFVKHFTTYGSKAEPLTLSITRQKALDVKEMNCKIISKVPEGVVTQRFFLNGLDCNEDYQINVTLNKDNACFVYLINDGQKIQICVNYNKKVEPNTIASFILQHL